MMINKKRRCGFYFKEICMWHDAGPCSFFDQAGGHVQPGPAAEHPETKRRLRNLLEVTGLLERLIPIKAEPATLEQVLRCHSERYINYLQQASQFGFGDGGLVAPFRKDSYDIALHSAGMVCDALTSVMKGDLDVAYTLNRPPGHHAMYDQGCGFCLLSNIPIAIESLIHQQGNLKIAVVDWDVHHGNGTEAAFYDRHDVLSISIHQDNNFPLNSGSADDIGSGLGEGYNLNIPLPPGCGIGAYLYAMERLVIPAVRNFQPDLIVIASGYDASAMDPLGSMMLNSSSYAKMMQMILVVVDELCDGKVVAVHEGGYAVGYVEFCGHALINELSGEDIHANDSLDDEIASWGYQSLQAHQKKLIDELAAKRFEY